MKCVAYIRGGLGDVWPAICALKSFTEKNKIKREDILIISDSVYYVRNDTNNINFTMYMNRKLTDNIVFVPPVISGIYISISEMLRLPGERETFMAGRCEGLKSFVKGFIKEDTIFIDAPCPECILKWNGKKKIYEDIGKERKVFTFNPYKKEKVEIDEMLKHKHILIHVRKNLEVSNFSSSVFEDLIKKCVKNGYYTMVTGYSNLDLNFEGEGSQIEKSRVLVFDPSEKGDLFGYYNSTLSCEGMMYLITQSKLMVSTASGFAFVKVHDQNEDNKLISLHIMLDWAHWLTDTVNLNNNTIYDINIVTADEIMSKIKEVTNESKKE